MPLMAEGEFALGRGYLERALEKTAHWTGDHDLYAMLADTAVRQRDEAALRKYAPLAEELAIRHGHGLYQAVAHRTWGVAHRLAGEYAEAHARLNQALGLFTGLGTRWQMGRTHFELAELAQAQNDPAEAQAQFAHALAAFEAMGAQPDVARTQARLQEVGTM